MPPFDGLPEALQALRSKKGWSQADLGRAASLDPAQISKYEVGAASPTVATLDKILEALGSSVTQLGRELDRIAGKADLVLGQFPRSEFDRVIGEALERHGVAPRSRDSEPVKVEELDRKGRKPVA